jgi:hypothetical protein
MVSMLKFGSSITTIVKVQIAFALMHCHKAMATNLVINVLFLFVVFLRGAVISGESSTALMILYFSYLYRIITRSCFSRKHYRISIHTELATSFTSALVGVKLVIIIVSII